MHKSLKRHTTYLFWRSLEFWVKRLWKDYGGGAKEGGERGGERGGGRSLGWEPLVGAGARKIFLFRNRTQKKELLGK
jgi:hypothetical protein